MSLGKLDMDMRMSDMLTGALDTPMGEVRYAYGEVRYDCGNV